MDEYNLIRRPDNGWPVVDGDNLVVQHKVSGEIGYCSILTNLKVLKEMYGEDFMQSDGTSTTLAMPSTSAAPSTSTAAPSDTQDPGPSSSSPFVAPGKAHWSSSSTKLLIHLIKEAQKDFVSTTKKNCLVYKQITADLNNGQNTFRYSPTQVEDKWRHLKKQYMKKVDNMSAAASGAAVFNFEFFEDIDEFLGKKSNVRPQFLKSSRGVAHGANTQGEVTVDLLEDTQEAPQQSAKRMRLESAADRRHADFMEVFKMQVDIQKGTLDAINRCLNLLEQKNKD